MRGALYDYEGLGLLELLGIEEGCREYAVTLQKD